MEDKKTIFSFLESVFCTFGISIFMLMFVCKIFGDGAKSVSTMFEFGSDALTISMLFQFFAIAVVTVSIQYLVSSERVMKIIPAKCRMICTLTVPFLTTTAFIYFFRWFATQVLMTWVMFIVCYIFSAGIAVIISAWKEKVENRQMEEALNRLKRQWEKEEHDKQDM